jgi:hypothetical protein
MLYIIEGDATNPRRIDASATVYLPHCCNDAGGWGSGFVNAITAKWGQRPREMYKQWYAGKTSAEMVDLFRSDDLNDPHFISHSRFALGGKQLIRLPDNMELVNMIGQHNYGRDSDLEISNKGTVEKLVRPPVRYVALAKAMHSLMDYIENRHMIEGSESPFEIHCPKFGSDLAGGDWNIIQQMIAEIWVDRGADVVVYEWVKK